MAEFQVRAMADGGSPEDLPQRGRVTEVCREWLLHEDQALAYRLQNEEYQSHLGNNRERNQLLRQDTPKAKEEQIREDHEAALAQTAYELALAQQEARDADLAANLALKLNVQDMEKQKQQEEQDMLYARCLMEREKESIRQNRELRQVEREAAYLGINSGSDNVALLSRKERRERDVNGTVSSDRSAQSNTSAVSSDLSDLSDFCLQPTEDMDEEEQRALQEGQDAPGYFRSRTGRGVGTSSTRTSYWPSRRRTESWPRCCRSRNEQKLKKLVRRLGRRPFRKSSLNLHICHQNLCSIPLDPVLRVDEAVTHL